MNAWKRLAAAWIRFKVELARAMLEGSGHAVVRDRRQPVNLPPQHMNCRCAPLPPGCHAFDPDPNDQTLADAIANGPRFKTGGNVGTPTRMAMRNLRPVYSKRCPIDFTHPKEPKS